MTKGTTNAAPTLTQIAAFEKGFINTRSGMAVQVRMFKDVMAALDVLIKRANDGDQNAVYIMGDLVKTEAGEKLFDDTMDLLGSDVSKFVDGDGKYIPQAKLVVADLLVDDITIEQGAPFRLSPYGVDFYLAQIDGRLNEGQEARTGQDSLRVFVNNWMPQ